MSEGYSTSGYHIELLKSDNWMLWKRQMLAILRDLNLEKFIEKTAMSPLRRIRKTQQRTKPRRWTSGRKVTREPEPESSWQLETPR